MPAFFEYLRNITYYLMFASIVGMFAPAGKYRKFVSLVLGFVLLLLMVQPLVGFFRGNDVPVSEWFAGALPDIRGENADFAGADWWDYYLAGAFETQLEAQLSRLLAANGFSLDSAGFEYSNDFSRITAVRARVSRTASREPERIPFIRIQPVRIGDAPAEAAETCPYADAVKTLISEFYNLPTAHIHVEINY